MNLFVGGWTFDESQLDFGWDQETSDDPQGARSREEAPVCYGPV